MSTATEEPPTQRNYEAEIDHIMGTFDFERVHEAMHGLRWFWHVPGPPHIPSMEEIKEHAIKILRQVTTSTVPAAWNRYSCGGFVADDETGALRLSFVIESEDAHGEDDEP